MPDLSQLSDAELLKLHAEATSGPDLSKVSDADLLRMHAEATAPNPKAKGEGIDVKGLANAGMRGVAQGSTFGFADEAAGALGGLRDYAAGKLGLRGDISLSDAYHTNRDAVRRADARAEEEHPIVFGGSQLVGGLATAAVPGLGALNIGKGAKVAEVVGKGAAMGALSGAGGAKEFTDIPEGTLTGAATGAAAGAVLHGAGKALSYAAGRVLPVAAKVVGGVSEENLGKYLAGRERINAAGALPETAVQDAIDQGVARAVGDSQALTTNAAKLEEGINQAYKAKTAELVGKTTPLAKAKEMTAALEAQKGYLGSLSEQADDALARSGASFSRDDLLRSIDKIGTSKGAAIGDEAHAALAKLQSTRDRIAAQLPPEIPAVQMRDVLKQLRKDVNFDLGSGEFNDTLNGMRKEFSGQISNALKKEVPEYAQYMGRMSDLAENLGTMNRYFGDESKSLGALETLRKGGARAQLIEDALKNHATVNADQTMLDHLVEVRNGHALLDRVKAGEDLRPELFPKEWAALQEANANAARGAASAGEVNRLGPNRTQAVIRNQGGTIPNVVDQRALEALSRKEGVNYPQMIEDKNVFDAFKKGQTNGSRMAVMGGTMGGALGYSLAGPTGATVGASLGSLAGGTLDKYGPAIVKGTIDSAAALREMLASTSGVKALGPYAEQLAAAAAQGNKTLAVVNAMLLKTDPSYRAQFKDPQQQQRDAINRRIGN